MIRKIILAASISFLVAGFSRSNFQQVWIRNSGVDSIYRYTQSGIAVFTGSRSAAQNVFGCAGNKAICAKAWTLTIPPQRVPSMDIFENY